MYRFTPSSQPVANPLQGLIGLGAVSSYYRTPIYSCAEDQNVIEYSKHRCSTRKKTTTVNYKKGYSTILKGTQSNPYKVTYSDVYSSTFDACRVKLLKVCSAPRPSQPVVVNTPEELTVIPVPTHQVPIKPGTIIVDSPDDLIQLPIPPLHPGPVKQPEATPVLISSLPSPSKEQLDQQMLQEFTKSSKAGVTVELPSYEEEEESDSSKYLIGGILLLAVGGGAAYYFLRKKRK
jgi:hypothetical protein